MTNRKQSQVSNPFPNTQLTGNNTEQPNEEVDPIKSHRGYVYVGLFYNTERRATHNFPFDHSGGRRLKERHLLGTPGGEFCADTAAYEMR